MRSENKALSRANYCPVEDAIYMPSINSFKSTTTATASENYYSIILHELVHWTIKEERSPREDYAASSC